METKEFGTLTLNEITHKVCHDYVHDGCKAIKCPIGEHLEPGQSCPVQRIRVDELDKKVRIP
jgi:hypothetical protein